MRSLVLVALIAAAVGRAGDAAAQPGMSEPQPLVPAAPPVQGEPLSEGVALGLSLGGTIASWALLVAVVADEEDDHGTLATLGLLGTYVAPSAGHWYAGSFLTRGLGIRTAGAVATFAAIVKLISCDGCNDAEVEYLFYGGLLLYAAGTIDDIFNARGKVRQKNRERGFTIAPVVTPQSTGLALGGRF